MHLLYDFDSKTETSKIFLRPRRDLRPENEIEAEMFKTETCFETFASFMYLVKLWERYMWLVQVGSQQTTISGDRRPVQEIHSEESDVTADWRWAEQIELQLESGCFGGSSDFHNPVYLMYIIYYTIRQYVQTWMQNVQILIISKHYFMNFFCFFARI